jgi:tyrosyl-tRNA synthetase
MKNIDKDVLLAKWGEISSLAQKTFKEKISAADLEKVKGNANAMISLVEERLGISREDAQKKVEEIYGKIKSHDLAHKAEVTAGKALETASALLDVLKEKIQKK